MAGIFTTASAMCSSAADFAEEITEQGNIRRCNRNHLPNGNIQRIDDYSMWHWLFPSLAVKHIPLYCEN